MIGFGLIWLTVALGISADSVETASNTPMFLILLPFLGSGFVPTDSMPTVVRYFAEYQPFTPVKETLRGLLEGPGTTPGRLVRPITVLSAIWRSPAPTQGDAVG